MALRGIQVLELGGLAPAPFCGMVLADFGAKVLRIDKLSGDLFGTDDILAHGKLSVALNFKTKEGIEVFKKLSLQSDVVIDPFRPGVMEKLTIGPDDLMKTNDRLIYARLTGYGQHGPMAKSAGHDINYTAMSGALSFLGGRSDVPTPPVNLLADFAGGGLTAALGILMALYEREKSGMGQVVDCSMTRGAAYVSSWLSRGFNTFLFCNKRGSNLLDGGAFYYDNYRTKDGKWIAVGALEPKFYSNLLEGLGIPEEELPQTTEFEIGRAKLEDAFMKHDQHYWEKVFSHLDACVTPVLTPIEAANHKHNAYQKSYHTFQDGILAPSPEPRMSRTPSARNPAWKAPRIGEHTLEILKSVGYQDAELEEMVGTQVIGVCDTTSKL
uniref:Alpha-methylacyl-CoA racemase n=1 Tax=Lygus hesperus TaxID=30085 RepID=A0A0A9WTM5_LYGHE